jgi:hypothetical protein
VATATAKQHKSPPAATTSRSHSAHSRGSSPAPAGIRPAGSSESRGERANQAWVRIRFSVCSDSEEKENPTVPFGGQ